MEFQYKEQKEETEIIPENIKKILRKMSIWKAPDPYFIQRFWLKNLKGIQEGPRRNFAKMLRKWKRVDVDDKWENNTNVEK